MLEINGLTKYYGDLLAVDNLSFRIDQGEFATVLGPSGCGKSTTLHAIAGLIAPTEGSIELRGVDVTETPPNERNIGLVFQHSALFPHMTVEENLRYGLRMQGVEKSVHDERIERYLELVQMPAYGDHKPDELSGGQQRRISLARALVYEPDILLLDEPLTGLDRVLREDMRNEIDQIQREVGVTTLHVTHDQEEALSMSDRVIVMNDGKKEQEGTPRELYQEPSTRFVADFIGKSTRFEGKVSATEPLTIESGGHRIQGPKDAPAEVGEDVLAYVRPEAIEVPNPGASEETNSLVGKLIHTEYLGSHVEIEVELANGVIVTTHVDPRRELTTGDEVTIRFNPEDVVVL